MEHKQLDKVIDQQKHETQSVTFLVVGGGIAGVSCAETIAICCPKESILLLTESSIIKTVANLEPIARYLVKFDVKEVSSKNNNLSPCVVTVVDQLQQIDTSKNEVSTPNQRIIKYRYLCICTGGKPRLIANGNPRVIGIRDTDSVIEFQRQLKDARRIVLVGNGGIASELAHELHDVEIHWVVKDNHIASTFVDPGAAHFFLQGLKTTKSVPHQAGAIKRLQYAEIMDSTMPHEHGAALGPDWHRNFDLKGQSAAANIAPIIHYKVHIQNIVDAQENKGDGLTCVTLSTGERIQCDFVISATGVDPRHDFSTDQEFKVAADGGLIVNEMMETNIPGIYAAGDVCSVGWEPSKHWFQMRLWTQARQMGAMAGRSMAAAFNGETIYQDFCFELFGHVTQLFGYSVVLLGRYNGQGLGTDYEILLRSTPGKEYIKFVLQNGCLRGAILIGNSDLAETCENLILNGTDLTPFGDDILNPNIDIEDYFD